MLDSTQNTLLLFLPQKNIWITYRKFLFDFITNIVVMRKDRKVWMASENNVLTRKHVLVTCSTGLLFNLCYNFFSPFCRILIVKIPITTFFSLKCKGRWRLSARGTTAWNPHNWDLACLWSYHWFNKVASSSKV